MEILSHKIKGGQKFEQWNSNDCINWSRSSTTIFTFWTNGISNDGGDCIFYDGKMNEKEEGKYYNALLLSQTLRVPRQ